MEEIILWLDKYRYGVLLPLAVVEGPMVTVFAGLLCSPGFLSLTVCYPLVVAGGLIGDSFDYALGTGSRYGWAKKMGERMGLTQQRLNRMRGIIGKGLFRSIVLSKIILGAGFTGLFLMGKLRVPYRRFLAFCFYTAVLQTGFYLAIGWFFGVCYKQINRYMSYAAAVSIVGFLGLLFVFFLRSKLKSHESSVRRQQSLPARKRCLFVRENHRFGITKTRTRSGRGGPG